MTYPQVAHKLKALGCDEIAQSGDRSHRKWANPANKQATTLPDWGSRDLKLGTVRSAVRQLQLRWKEFLDV